MVLYVQRPGGIDPRNSLQVKQANKPTNQKPLKLREVQELPKSTERVAELVPIGPLPGRFGLPGHPFPETHSPAQAQVMPLPVCGGADSPSLFGNGKTEAAKGPGLMETTRG